MAIGGGVGKLLITIGLKSTVKADGKRVEKETGAIAKGIEKKGLIIGAGMTAVGVGAKLMADNINRSYLTFDSAMAEVKSLGGVTKEQMDIMRDSAIGISKELPLSAKNVAEGFYMMRSAGFDAARVIEELPAIAKMAVAGNLDMADAVNATTMVLDTYGERAGSAADITNVLMGTVQAFKTTLPELQKQLSKNIGVASSLGISFGELAAMSGMLKKEFVSAEEAGTAMKTMLLRLVDPKIIADLDELGVTVVDNNGNFVGMESVLEELSIMLDEAGGDVSKMAALQKIFGTEGLRAAMALIRQKDELKSYTNAVKSGKSVQEALNAVLESTQSQLDIANNKMEAAKITMGEAMAPATIFMAEAMAGFAGVLEDIPRPLQTVIGGGMQLSQVLIGIGPLLMGISAIYPMYAAAQLSAAAAGTTLTASIWASTVALLANPLLWIALIIVGVVAALYLLEERFGVLTAIVDFFKDAFGGLVDACGWLIDSLFGIGDASEDAAGASENLAEAQERVAESAREVDELTESYEELKDVVEDVKDLTESYDDNLRSVEHATFGLEDAQADYNKAVKEFGKNSREAAKADLRVRDAQDRLNDAKERSIKLEKELAEANTESTELMKENGVSTLEELEKVLNEKKAAYQANLDEVERLEAKAEAEQQDRLARIRGFLGEHWDKVIALAGPIGGIVAAYRNWDEITEIISRVKEKVFEHVESLKTKFTEIYEKVKSTFMDIKTAIAERMSKVLETIKKPFVDAYNYIIGLPGKFRSAGEALIQAIIDGIKSLVSKPADLIMEALEAVRELLPLSDAKVGPLSDLSESGKAVLGTFAAGMKTARADLGGTFEKTLPTDMAAGVAGSGGASYGGDTYNFGPITISNDYDVERMWAKIQEFQQAKRVQRGINAI